MGLRLIAGFAPAVGAVLFFSSTVYAATSPSLGTASTYGVLSSTYTNTVAGTTINGDLGYTTGPGVAPTVTGNTNDANAAYTQAGADQASALAALNSQACTFTFASGAIDLATDTTHGTLGVYAPGVYCITGAASIGAAGIRLNGSGVYIFRMSGALTTTAASAVTLSNGASPTDLWWTAFAGSDIDNAGITIGSLVTWSGNALAYGGTVSTSQDTITGSTFTTAPAVGNGSGSGSSSGSTSASSNAAASSTEAGAPATGFGTPSNNPFNNLADYIFASSIVVLLAGLLVKQRASRQA
jgi:hypothetical protein